MVVFFLVLPTIPLMFSTSFFNSDMTICSHGMSILSSQENERL